MKRYILNLRARVYHDRQHLTENCNTDSIDDRAQADMPPADYKPCEWCQAGEEERPSGAPSDAPDARPMAVNPSD